MWILVHKAQPSTSRGSKEDVRPTCRGPPLHCPELVIFWRTGQGCPERNCSIVPLTFGVARVGAHQCLRHGLRMVTSLVLLCWSGLSGMCDAWPVSRSSVRSPPPLHRALVDSHYSLLGYINRDLPHSFDTCLPPTLPAIPHRVTSSPCATPCTIIDGI